ncbi:MAG: membrane dipeptidase [Myxococcota bacterium]
MAQSKPPIDDAALGAARALIVDSEVIDLHLDSFIWTRIFGYRLDKRHGRGLLGGRFYSQTDFPRALEAGLTGGTWIITTNPVRPRRNRRDTFWKNLADIEAILEAAPKLQLVRNVAEYNRARAEGKHGAFLGIQGGNALDVDLSELERLDERILRITLVHLTNSRLGATSAPLGQRFPVRGGGSDGLTDLGRDYVRACNANKIFVDLAHISRKGFFDAVAVHDQSQPLLVTHTGIAGVYEHWRNVTDAQLRAVADTGGVVGVMFQKSFLGARDVDVFTIVDHLAHIVDVIGEDHAALGSDYDGAIVPPDDMATLADLPRLVAAMRTRFSDRCVQKILGENALRVIRELRG